MIGDSGTIQSASSNEQWWANAVDFALYSGETIDAMAGSFTVGCRFAPIRPVKVTGVRFYAKGFSGKTARCSLWDPGGVRVTYVDIAVGADGAYTGAFTVAQTLNTTIQKARTYGVSVWITDRTVYTKTDSDKLLTGEGLNGPRVWCPLAYRGYYGAGDANPGSLAATERYLVDPILEQV